jgi:hypothetical protein
VKRITFLNFVVLLMCVWVFSVQAQVSDPGIEEAKFDPERPATGDDLKLVVKLKGSAVRAEIRWSLNGEDAGFSDYAGFGEAAAFPKKINSGDKIVAQVTPFDGYGKAGPVVKSEITVAAAQPIATIKDERIMGNTYTAKVEASDPQGGTLTYSILKGPDGLTVDQSGNVKWQIPEGAGGSTAVLISVKSEKGGESQISYTIGLKWQKQK